MDLSFAPFDQNSQVTALPSDLAVMLVGVAARQAASPTALVQANVERPLFDDTLFAPLHGAFNAAVAKSFAASLQAGAVSRQTALTDWKVE